MTTGGASDQVSRKYEESFKKICSFENYSFLKLMNRFSVNTDGAEEQNLNIRIIKFGVLVFVEYRPLTKGSYKCSCMEGFQLKNEVCEDIDECDVENGECNQLCENSVGSFTCQCFTGYMPQIENPSLCLEIDICNNGAKCSHDCINIAGMTYSEDKKYIFADDLKNV